MSHDLFELFNTVRERANDDPHLKHIGRFCTLEFLVQSGEQSVHLVIDRGVIAQIVKGPLHMRAWRFALRANPAHWDAFWAPLPAVGFNDIFAMSRYGHLSIDGDIAPLLEHLRYIKEILALPRRLGDATPGSTATGAAA